MGTSNEIPFLTSQTITRGQNHLLVKHTKALKYVAIRRHFCVNKKSECSKVNGLLSSVGVHALIASKDRYYISIYPFIIAYFTYCLAYLNNRHHLFSSRYFWRQVI